MNAKPNTAGISRYWKRGEDDRPLLARKMSLDPESGSDRAAVDAFLEGLLSLVKRRKRTKFVGFGIFEWIRWNNRLPTGKFVETWRLTFKPCRYVKGKYNGDK